MLDLEGGAVTPIAMATDKAGPQIRAGSFPSAIAITPDGATAYVGTVTPISTSSSAARAALPVGLYDYSTAISFEPSGPMALVVDTYAGQVTPVDTATGHVYPAITVGGFPVAVAITS